MDRRKFLAFLAAGGIVTAEGLWMPGRKLISIPKYQPYIRALIGAGNDLTIQWPMKFNGGYVPSIWEDSYGTAGKDGYVDIPLTKEQVEVIRRDEWPQKTWNLVRDVKLFA